jgi:ribosomal protein S18 acetylase RimI-like enzyme
MSISSAAAGSSVVVRRADAGDCDDVTRLFIELRDHHRQLQPRSPRYAVDDDGWAKIARTSLEDDAKTILVAEVNGHTVGFVKLGLAQKPWGLSCEVETLVVQASARGKGHGTRLMDAAEDFACAEGTQGIRVDVLVTNDLGRGFYERAGYEPLSLRYGKPTPGVDDSGSAAVVS